ncbi:hypothetical protein EG329_014246 [Mollisiaceae sp. DMI_Dod_QoI]|nr:hypothetical protein EG329_014246 [Helotiales sp. DMI_Dod_QoI]
MESTFFRTILFLLTFVSLILCINLPPSDPTKAGTLGVMQFNGTIHGVEVELNGTVQEIYAQFLQMHPEITANLTTAGSHTLSSKSLETLEARFKSTIYCCPVASWGWLPANVPALNAGIEYLDNFKGSCSAGGHGCARISCSNGAAIWLCNDNDFTIYENCGYMATYVDDLATACGLRDQWGGYTSVCGQEFDTFGYNIIVRADAC